MTIAEKTGLKDVDRYWRQVEAEPRHAHTYVSLLGLRTYDTAQLHERIDETPLEFATTEIGAREVANLIGRLEHGVVL